MAKKGAASVRSESPSTKTAMKQTPTKQMKHVTRKQANRLVMQSEIAIKETLEQLQGVRVLASKAGLSIECNRLPKTSFTAPATDPDNDAVLSPPPTTFPAQATTGGHSNTDHNIIRTGNERIDRVAELRRNLWRRYRLMEPETRQDSRWDRPRLPGERRRRVVREKDLPEAPPEPPLSGFIAFLYQITVKLRHDRPDLPHDQTKVVQEASKLWRIGLTDEERAYYNEFANDARSLYERQMIEYRATGSYTPSEEFIKLEDANVWVRKESKRNDLEREICAYESLKFPKRPASMEEEYELRQQRSVFKRKLRLKGLENPDGSLKNGLDFEELFRKEQEKKAKQLENQSEENGTERLQQADEVVTFPAQMELV